MMLDQPFGGVIPGAWGAVLSTLMRTDTPLTGRQVHALVADRFGLSTVQQTLRDLAALGMTETLTVGRAGTHAVNEGHVAVAQLRPLLSPWEVLTETVRSGAGDVVAVLLFGSSARGDATPGSDIDLAVIASSAWQRRVELEDAVRIRFGNRCDVLHLTPEEITAPAGRREPVVAEILRDGVALVGALPVTDDLAAS